MRAGGLAAIPRVIGALPIVLAICACGTTQLESDATTFDVRDSAAPRLRGQQAIAVKNAYSAPKSVVVLRQGENRLVSDLKALTDTAIAILERRMKRDGITVDSASATSVTLRISEPSVLVAGPFAVLGTVTLETELGSGTKRVFRIKNNTNNAERALDGAVFRGVVELLKDEEFRAYVNGS